MNTTTIPGRHRSVLPWINLSLGVAAVTLASVAIAGNDTANAPSQSPTPKVVVLNADPSDLVADLGSCGHALPGDVVRC
ncbi:MAG TPA: hypothetical protein VL916_02270 [Ilumatobacteraceae bacterium]|nr:hypothetical protein [Ilumatobacteraceae bacterium]